MEQRTITIDQATAAVNQAVQLDACMDGHSGAGDGNEPVVQVALVLEPAKDAPKGELDRRIYRLGGLLVPLTKRQVQVAIATLKGPLTGGSTVLWDGVATLTSAGVKGNKEGRPVLRVVLERAGDPENPVTWQALDDLWIGKLRPWCGQIVQATIIPTDPELPMGDGQGELGVGEEPPGVPVNRAELEELTERAVNGDQAARVALSDDGEEPDPTDPRPCPKLAEQLDRLGFVAGLLLPGHGAPHQYWMSPCGRWQLCLVRGGVVTTSRHLYYVPDRWQPYAELQADQVLPLAVQAADAPAFLAAIVELVGTDPQVEEPAREGEAEAEEQPPAAAPSERDRITKAEVKELGNRLRHLGFTFFAGSPGYEDGAGRLWQVSFGERKHYVSVSEPQGDGTALTRLGGLLEHWWLLDHARQAESGLELLALISEKLGWGLALPAEEPAKPEQQTPAPEPPTAPPAPPQDFGQIANRAQLAYRLSQLGLKCPPDDPTRTQWVCDEVELWLRKSGEPEVEIYWRQDGALLTPVPATLAAVAEAAGKARNSAELVLALRVLAPAGSGEKGKGKR